MNKLWTVIGIGAAALALIIFSMWFTTTNKEAVLKADVEAYQQKCKVNFDNMWKTIKQVAQVPEHYSDEFRKNFTAIMNERYGGERGGALLKFVKESNPNFDVSLYAKLQRTIEAERTSFKNNQETLIDKNMQHNNMFKVKPSKWFLDIGDTTHITLITSGKTNESYITGEDNDMKLFDDKD